MLFISFIYFEFFFIVIFFNILININNKIIIIKIFVLFLSLVNI